MNNQLIEQQGQSALSAQIRADDPGGMAERALEVTCQKLSNQYPQLNVFTRYVAAWKKTNGNPMKNPEVFRQLVGEYVEERAGQVKPQSLNMDLCGLKAAVREMIAQSVGTLTSAQQFYLEKMITEKPFKLTRRAVRTVGKDKMLEPGEVMELIAGTSDKISLVIELLVKTGCRISEVVNAKWTDMAPTAGGHLRLEVLGKGKKLRSVKVKVDLARRIKRTFAGKIWLFEHHGQAYGRNYLLQKIQEAGFKILGKRIGPHTLRHSFATHMIDRTGNVKAVSLLLGHSDISITLAMYYHRNEVDDSDLSGFWAEIDGK